MQDVRASVDGFGPARVRGQVGRGELQLAARALGQRAQMGDLGRARIANGAAYGVTLRQQLRDTVSGQVSGGPGDQNLHHPTNLSSVQDVSSV